MCEQNLKRKAAVILSLCMAVSGVSLVLGGCTRREQLVLETADMADESRGGEPGLTGQFPAGEAAGTDSERIVHQRLLRMRPRAVRASSPTLRRSSRPCLATALPSSS